MKNFFLIFTRNWGLKLLALILALVVFYGVRGSIRGSYQHVDPAIFMKGPAHAVPAR